MSLDPSVIAALAKWPNVPDVYGWLSLDRRGKWRLKDEPISHQGATDFISRNYDQDKRGAWYFQNGPQRVYARLDYTPWILHIGEQNTLVTHTGLTMQAAATALLDEQGNMLIGGEHGIGLVDDRDLAALLDATCDRRGNAVGESALHRIIGGEVLPVLLRWGNLRLPLLPVRSGSVPERFSFVADPQPEDLG